MGSGLILLVIVGAWLAVLVPMALKSHESAASLTSVDRFNDAMRVLSRREERYAARRAVVMPARPAEVLEPVGLTAAERRRRTLAVLIGTALVSLGLALMSVPVMMPLHVVCDLLLVGFVVHLRRQAVLRAERRARQRPVAVPAQRRAVAEEPAPAAVRVAGVPDRMPRRPEPLTASLPAPAARYDEATVVVDDSWEPVPVPPPTYVGKPVAPARPPRVLDLTKPGEWSASFEDDDTDLIEVAELDDILDRRRAANGW